jgi:predicted O-methyltransferase YrrM
MKSADSTVASQDERFIVRGDPQARYWAARSAASGPVWSQRSRDYLVRIKAEVPEHASEWKLFDDLDHTGAAYTPNYPTPSGGYGAYFDQIEAAPTDLFDTTFLINLGIKGYLLKAEALKLYEMGFNAPGDVLELGTHKGLSTSILAHALHDRRSGRLVTVDIDKVRNLQARWSLAWLPGARRIRFRLRDATVTMDELKAKQRSFGFIFVDHWHGYDATHEAAIRIHDLLTPAGYVMFHDFFDAANRDPHHVYGVYQAVVDAIGEERRLVFAGAAGAAALFRKLGKPPPRRHSFWLPWRQAAS